MPGNGIKKRSFRLIAARSGHGHFAKGLDMKKKGTYIVNAARGDQSLTLNPFNCSSARSLRVKLFSVIDRIFLTQKEVLGKVQGIKMLTEWAPKTELLRRSKKMRDRVLYKYTTDIIL